MKKMPGPMKPVLILQIVVCSTAGLSLLPASDLTVQNFSLVCDFEGAAWTSILLFNYNGKSGGGCGSPPNPTCTSSIGTITTSNDQTATLTLSQSNILTVGDAEWTCTHASQPTGRYNASVIAVCSNGVVKQEDKKLNIRCSCGFPSVKATLEYQDEDENSLSSSVAVLENATSSTSCVDTRAMDFSYQAPYFPSSASKVCVTFTTLSQISAQVKNCTKIGSTTESTTYISTAVITMLTETSDTTVVSTETVSSTSDTSVASSSSGSTQSVGTSSEIVSVVTTPSEGLSEELIIIISIGSSCGAILLFSVVTITIVLCCRRKTDSKNTGKENHGRKLDKLHVKKDSRKDLNSNSGQHMNWKYPESRITRHEHLSSDYLHQRPNDAGYRSRMFPGYNPRSFHHYPETPVTGDWRDYGNRNVAYYQPYANGNNVMLYHTQHPGHRHGGDSMGYRQSEPYRMQQDYQTPYIKRYDESFEKVVEGRGDQRRGNYESSWDTLY